MMHLGVSSAVGYNNSPRVIIDIRADNCAWNTGRYRKLVKDIFAQTKIARNLDRIRSKYTEFRQIGNVEDAMKIYRKLALALGLLFPSSHAAFAQLPSPAVNPVESDLQEITIFGNQSASAVPGAPYSAIEESLYSQKQPDGTYENRSLVTTHIYRDSQGKTRAERYMTSYLPGAGEPKLTSIYITDPQAGVVFRLDAENHRAYRRAWNASARALSFEASTGLNDSTTEEPHYAETTELLGNKTMEALAVEGTRQTLNVPAGAQGNNSPFQILVETWISPELKVAVLTKRDNSIVGMRTTRLTKIDRSEPYPALFQVPLDYKIDEASSEVHSSIAY
jgi:hypothetical protein